MVVATALETAAEEGAAEAVALALAVAAGWWAAEEARGTSWPCRTRLQARRLLGAHSLQGHTREVKHQPSS